jgi:hypothetical protein
LSNSFSFQLTQQLLTKGLVIFGRDQSITIHKPAGVGGNNIPGWKSIPVITKISDDWDNTVEYRSDSPLLHLRFDQNRFFVHHHNWIPGPGPGDFSLDFETEQQAIDFIISYYFGENKYFEELKAYLQNNLST